MARSLLLVLSFVFSVSATADMKCPQGPTFKDTLTVSHDNGSKTDVFLNGVGIKKILFFKVFYGALYLENKTKNSINILKSKNLKVGHIHTLRAIKKSQLASMWNDEFMRLCADRCNKLMAYHKKFLTYARDLKKSDDLYLLIFDNRIELEINGNEFYEPIYSAEYGLILQRGLFGPDASDKKLENGLLGKEVICKNV